MSEREMSGETPETPIDMIKSLGKYAEYLAERLENSNDDDEKVETIITDAVISQKIDKSRDSTSLEKHVIHKPTIAEIEAMNQKPKPIPLPEVSGDWENRAACRPGLLPAGIAIDDFFAPDKKDKDSPRQVLVKKICNGDALKNILPCPVKTDCLEDALSQKLQSGIRGGLTERERKKIIRKS